MAINVVCVGAFAYLCSSFSLNINIFISVASYKGLHQGYFGNSLLYIAILIYSFPHTLTLYISVPKSAVDGL